MSIIIAKKEKDIIWVGSDSQESSGESSQENYENCKLRQINKNVFCGVVGDGHFGSLLFTYLEENDISDIDSSMKLVEFFKEFSEWALSYLQVHGERPNPILVSQTILVIKNEVWQFNNYYIRKLKEGEFVCVGAGGQCASACLSLNNLGYTVSIEDALIATCAVDLYCSGPIVVHKIKIDTTKFNKNK